MSENETITSVALTPRHGCPADSNIWPETVENVLDFEAHYQTAKQWLTQHVVLDDGELRDLDKRITEVRLYVTGLSPLLAAFLNAWATAHRACGATCKTKLMLMHWDRDSSSYIGQRWVV